ncbi:MAG TPA: biliverdin-producing heme oxygenase, partial [Pyrinomonadaceae bacterium]|nr:biliverdin-producing heme oxygenase [Pyrinomonadaceae bacterium]
MILKQLKESTREMHEQVESLVNVLDESGTLDSYRVLIARFYLLYRAIQGAMPAEELRAHGYDLAVRAKLSSLENDLAALEIADAKAMAGTPVPVSLDLQSLDRAFGAAYVLEGATLGGQVISRYLRSALGIGPANGGAFFNSYGKDVGPMWKEFGAAITAFAEAGGDDAAIIEGAKDTFELFIKCFADGRKVRSM